MFLKICTVLAALWAAYVSIEIVREGGGLLSLSSKADLDTVVFFDGHCNLCNGFVNFVIDRDPENRVRFGSIQSHIPYLDYMNAPTDLSTMVLVQNGKVYTHSEAALRSFALLSFPWNLVSVFQWLPSPIRDLGYRTVARYRYLLFGRTDTCRAPDPSLQQRFVDAKDLFEKNEKRKPAFS